MRQAGRSLPEYRAVRERYSLLDICRRPEVCAEVTVQPVRRLGVDAAILFSDIMVPLLASGVRLDIVEKVGPVIERPVRSSEDVGVLRPLESENVQFVVDDIAHTLELLNGSVPLIGFAGAPFTLASYLIEGRPSRDFLHTKRLMYRAPEIWHDLMTHLARLVSTYLVVQARAGVHALQVFDSWAGALSVDDYRRYVLPYSRQVFDTARKTDLPLIHFGTGTGSLLSHMAEAGGSTLGADWRIPLDDAWRRVGYDRGIQGNLDPMVLQGPWPVVRREADAILRRAAGRSGHVFNLGHGIHPETPLDNLQRLVEYVHQYTSADGA